MNNYLKRLGIILTISSIILIGCDKNEETINKEVTIENSNFIESKKEENNVNVNDTIEIVQEKEMTTKTINKETDYINEGNVLKETVEKNNDNTIREEKNVIKTNNRNNNEKKIENKKVITTQNTNIEKTINYKYIGDFVEVSFIDQTNQEFYFSLNDIGNSLENEYILSNIEYLYSVLNNEYGMDKEDFEGLKFYIVDGQIFNENEVDNKGEYYGFYNYDENAIYISNRLSKKELWSTLVHEFGHFTSKKILTITDYVQYFQYYSGGSRLITNKEDLKLLNGLGYQITDWNEFSADFQFSRESERKWGDRLEETFADDFSNIIELSDSIHGEQGETFTYYQCKTNNGCYDQYSLYDLRAILKNRIEAINEARNGIEVTDYIKVVENELYIKPSNQFLLDLGYIYEQKDNGTYAIKGVKREMEDNIEYRFTDNKYEIYYYGELTYLGDTQIIINTVVDKFEDGEEYTYEEVFLPISLLVREDLNGLKLKIENEKYYIYSEVH